MTTTGIGDWREIFLQVLQSSVFITGFTAIGLALFGIPYPPGQVLLSFASLVIALFAYHGYFGGKRPKR